MARLRVHSLCLGVCWLLAAIPLRGRLESAMTTHMLLQMPVLVLIGWGTGTMLERAWPGLRAAVEPFRWALLVWVIGTSSIWMIPRLLDSAAGRPFVDVAKVLSLTLTCGLPLRLAWFHHGPVVRGVLHVEALATVWRLGWLYLESPSRLCARYGLDDQYRLGRALVGVGVVYAAWLTFRALSDTGSEQPISNGRQVDV